MSFFQREILNEKLVLYCILVGEALKIRQMAKNLNLLSC